MPIDPALCNQATLANPANCKSMHDCDAKVVDLCANFAAEHNQGCIDARQSQRNLTDPPVSGYWKYEKAEDGYYGYRQVQYDNVECYSFLGLTEFCTCNPLHQSAIWIVSPWDWETTNPNKLQQGHLATYGEYRTPEYGSPEQCNGCTVNDDAAADIVSLWIAIFGGPWFLLGTGMAIAYEHTDKN